LCTSDHIMCECAMSVCITSPLDQLRL
jgi:hypothetical protein